MGGADGHFEGLKIGVGSADGRFEGLKIGVGSTHGCFEGHKLSVSSAYGRFESLKIGVGSAYSRFEGLKIGVGGAYDWHRTAVHQGYMEYTPKSGQRVVKLRQEKGRVWLVGRPFYKPHEQKHLAHHF